MYFSIYFTLIHQVVLIITATSSSRQFSRKAPGSRKIRAFVGVSISRCERECSLRSRCQGVVYKRRYPGCMLISNFRFDQTAADKTGTVLTTGFGDSGFVSCGSNTCSSAETCVEDGNGYDCRATECGYFSSFFTSVKGNTYTVASRVILGRGSIKLKVTCGSEGLWEADNSYSDTGQDCTSIFGGSGVYTLSSPVVDVYCDMDNDEGHWTVFQRRQDGTVEFLRGWDDYVAGFGNLEGEFWLGLESLYQILQTGEYELRIDMESFSGERRYAKYQTFFLAGQAENYRLTIGGFSGDAGDSLKRHNGMMYTTIDRDNDIWDGNCAQTYTGAWWFVNCHDSSLNGLYPPNGEDTYVHAKYITWKAWLGHQKSPKKTEMKIRRK